MESAVMSETLVLQYVAVGTIIGAALFWIVIRLLNRRKRRSGGCAGCALHEHCTSASKDGPSTPRQNVIGKEASSNSVHDEPAARN